MQAGRIGVTLDMTGRNGKGVDFDGTLVVDGRDPVTETSFS